jgi:hypothetical protein
MTQNPQAIVRALTIFPASYIVHVHADSRGALAGIQAYERECNARQRLRMAARPLLQLIAHLWSVRQKADLAHSPAQVSRSHCSCASCPSRTVNITWRCIKNFRLVAVTSSSTTLAALLSPFSKPPH